MEKDNWRRLDILARLIVVGFLIPAGVFALTEGDLILGIVALGVGLPHGMDLIRDQRESSND